MRSLLGCLLLATVLAPGMPARAQEADEPSTEAFFETVDVNLVNVEVVVTDRSGNPVLDLEKEDFEILEDGRPVAITNFYALRGERRAAAVRPGLEIPAGEGEAGSGPYAADDPAQRLYLIVYVDNFNIMPFHRNRVFRRVREFLRNAVGPGDKVMLVSYNRTLKTRVSFTSDPAVVSRELFEIEEETGYNVHRESERREVLRDIEESNDYFTPLTRARTYAESYHSDVQFTIDALRDLIATLGGLPGRKAILHVSDGLPQVPGEDLFQAIQEKYQQSSILSESRQYDTSRRFDQLAQVANGNRVSFYMIDAAGLRTPSSASVTTAHAGINAAIDSTFIHNLQAPLLRLSEQTGGRAIINSNDVKDDLARVQQDFESYYSLGYASAHGGTGRYHDLEVRVKGDKSYRVLHRAGYRDKPLQQRMNDSTMAALVFGEETNQLGLRLRVGEPVRRDEGRHFTVPITVEIPLGSVTMVPLGDAYEARVQLFLAALDSDGGTSEVQSLRIPIRVPKEEIERARTQSWTYEVPLLMRSGQHRLAVGIHDDLAGEESFVTRSFVVGRS